MIDASQFLHLQLTLLIDYIMTFEMPRLKLNRASAFARSDPADW